MAVLSESERSAVRLRLREDTPFWARNCATILTPQRQEVKLQPRPWQARTAETPAHMTPLDEALEKQRAAGMPQRIIILKARKLGMSTWVQAKFMQRLTQLPNEYALSIAHLRSAAGQLMDMAHRMYMNLPTESELGLGISVRPQVIGSGQTRTGSRWMSFGDRQRPHEASVYETMTAGSKGGGRASTPSMMHLSEAAHYEDPEFIVGALNAVPKEPGTIVVIESTANAFNEFYERWTRAVEGAEDPETGGLYLPLFYGWQDNPFNALPFVSDQARDRFERTIGDEHGGGDEEEIALIEQFGLSLEQLRWRRVTIAEECDGKLEMFHQEHPTTPEEAFIGSGNPVFSSVLISKAIKHAKEAPDPVKGVIRPVEWRERHTKLGLVKIPEKVVWVPETAVTAPDEDIWGGSRLAVWQHPLNDQTRDPDEKPEDRKPDSQHVLFGDIAQGTGTTVEDSDYSAVQIIDHITRMQCARYVSRIDVHDFPLVLFLMALYYNTGWLAPEVNGLGIGVVDTLAKDLRYPRLYRRRRAGDDQRQDQRERLLGWQTDTRTKPLMEQTFGQVLKEEGAEDRSSLRDPMTARQFTTYVSDEKGRHGAQKGTHDDLVMSWMGVQRVAFELKPRAENKRKPYEPRDARTGY